MKKLFILNWLFLQCLYPAEPLEDYLSYIKQLDHPNGGYREGEIEIVIDPAEISRIEKVQENRLLKKGFSAEQAVDYSRVGVVSEDQYWLWLRDAVYFPKMIPGTYDRLIWKSELTKGFPGVAILPILPSGRIVLNLNYRHATRSWELELPRGGVGAKETKESAALRELKEETGMVAFSLIFLGHIAPDSGTLSSVIPVFLGKIADQGEFNPEYSEAIVGPFTFTKEEIKEGLIQGFLEVNVEGKKQQIPLRDGFLTFALLQAELRNLL